MIKHVLKARVLLVVLVILGTALLFGTSCAQSPAQSQALKEQQKENEDLQKQLDEQKQQKKQEDLQQQVDDLKKQLDKQNAQAKPQPDQNSGDQSSQQSGVSGDSPDVVIENNGVDPSQAPQGVVVVSPDFNISSVDAGEAEAINGAIDYYQYVEVGDYSSTYSLLSDADQNYYTESEWVTANEYLDSQAAEFVVTGASYNDVGTGYPTYLIDVSVYYTDGSVEYRQTNFTNEHGYWAHALTMEEMGLFDSALYS